jgi:hypothetical protein
MPAWTLIGGQRGLAMSWRPAWLAFVPTAILDWLDNPAITREQLRDRCARARWAAIGLQPAADATTRQ